MGNAIAKRLGSPPFVYDAATAVIHKMMRIIRKLRHRETHDGDDVYVGGKENV